MQPSVANTNEFDRARQVSRARARLIPVVLLAGLLLWSSSAVLRAAEIYVVRFVTSGTLIEPPCKYLSWADHLVFHNTTAEDAVVRLLGVSNGPRRPEARDLIVPAGRSRSVAGTLLDWHPGTGENPWVNRLDLPSGVLVASRLQVSVGSGAPCPVVSDSRGVGATGFPVFRSLRAPNEPQHHFATDIGPDETGYAAHARINVGIYNAGSSSATATIEVHRGCDERLMDSRIVSIPANTMIQALGLTTRTGPGCTGSLTTALYTTYAIVRVDQPSLSYAVTLSNEFPPQIPVGISFTQ